MRHADKKIVLHAGEYCFDKAGTHVHTLLGSCISITLWHPQKLIGGMCHFALPRRHGLPESDKLDPRYAEDCVELFRHSTARHHTRISDYQVKIFGGGNMYERFTNSKLSEEEKQPIGDKNAAAAFSLMLAEKADILVAHVGEFGHRKIVFDISTGDVWVRFTQAKGAIGDTRSLDGRK